MNVLLFVTTMLMLLSLMTYGRIQTFRSLKLQEKQFEAHMTGEARDYINDEAAKRYNEIHVTTKEKSEAKNEKQVLACSKLSLKALAGGNFLEYDDPAARKLDTLFKKLMTFLYEDQPFFEEAEEEHHDFLNEIIRKVKSAIENLPKTQKFETAKDLATLDLRDSDLQNVFRKMLEGTATSKAEKKAANQAEDFLPEEGYLSLLDFLSMKQTTHIRVFLASPMVLMAVFDDADSVRSILRKRKELQLQVKNDSLTKEEASQQLEGFVMGTASSFDETILNFEVSSTDPNGYWYKH